MTQTNLAFREVFCHQPDWRYRLAIEYANCRCTVRPLECPLVDQCVTLIRQNSQSSGKPTRGHQLRLSQVSKSLHHAYELFSNAKYAELKLELEASILARQTDREIADATGLPDEICSIYEKVFFQVRDRLDAIDYIMIEVIGCSMLDCEPQSLAKQSLLKLAYCAGSPALEEILAIHRLASSNLAGEHRELIQQQVLANPKLRRLLTAERLQPFGIAANDLLSGLLGVSIEPQCVAQTTSEVTPEFTPVSYYERLREAG